MAVRAFVTLCKFRYGGDEIMMIDIVENKMVGYFIGIGRQAIPSLPSHLDRPIIGFDLYIDSVP